jgi:hypothetical protein
VEVDVNLRLDDWTLIPFNEVLTLGNMNFIHGVYHNKYCSFKHVSEYDTNVFHGHVHTNQCYTHHTQINNKPKQGVSVGCACNINPAYNNNRPNRWLHQFLFFYLLDNGDFTYYTPIIVDGMCVINDKMYGDGNE